MKKRFIPIALSLAAMVSFSACGGDESPVSIVYDEELIRLDIGEEIAVSAQFPDDEVIRWSCEDDSIAAVSPDGRVSGIANGITVITARTDSGFDNIGLVVGNGVRGSAAVIETVDEDGNVVTTTRRAYDEDSPITALEITLNGRNDDETLILANEDEAYLRVNVTPSDCDDPLEFTSSDTSVLEVDSDGTVYPKTPGTVTVTVTAPNGVEDTFKIFVR